MNEFLRFFTMRGLKDMITRGVVLYQVYKDALIWFDKGVLLQEDLEEIQDMYEEKEAQEKPSEPEEIPEEIETLEESEE